MQRRTALAAAIMLALNVLGASAQLFSERTDTSERARERRAAAENPLFIEKDSRAKLCILAAAEELAVKSSEPADIIAIAAFERCRPEYNAAMMSASIVFYQIPVERLLATQESWRIEWIRRAMARVVETRARRK